MATDLNSLLSTSTNVPTQSSKQTEALSSLANNFDNFLTILTTQLQNQDPLSPMDTTEFTNQLVMFADVEQSVRQSGQLEDLIKLNRQSEATAAVGYLGQQIKADYNEVNFQGESVKMSYNLPKEAKSATMEIYNGAGELVRLVTNMPTTVGDHEITWDGKDQSGNVLPNGPYSFQVGAKDEDDVVIDPTYKTQGIVTAVEFDGETTTLMMGAVKIPLSKVLHVEDLAA
ncbi:MAG: FlgD immunoglobulin-like domain containing protein [Alphaproteobacteria bacterium]|nr:FlgD immunoglobulin-like domain containing protein [Alphaproteobacteria bacterium]